MKRSAIRNLVTSVGLVATVSCGVSDPVPAIQLPSNSNSISAKIDGNPWAATGRNASATLSATGSLSVSGSGGATVDASYALFLVVNVNGPGMYSLADGSGSSGRLFLSGGSGVLSTSPQGAAGSVTITAISASHVTGTFQATVVLASGVAGVTSTIASGAFDLAINPF